MFRGWSLVTYHDSKLISFNASQNNVLTTWISIVFVICSDKPWVELSATPVIDWLECILMNGEEIKYQNHYLYSVPTISTPQCAQVKQGFWRRVLSFFHPSSKIASYWFDQLIFSPYEWTKWCSLAALRLLVNKVFLAHIIHPCKWISTVCELHNLFLKLIVLPVITWAQPFNKFKFGDSIFAFY